MTSIIVHQGKIYKMKRKEVGRLIHDRFRNSPVFNINAEILEVGIHLESGSLMITTKDHDNNIQEWSITIEEKE